MARARDRRHPRDRRSGRPGRRLCSPVRSSAARSTPGSAHELLSAIIACGCGLSAAAGQRWGVAIPGPFDYERGIGLFADVGKFEALCGVDVREALAAGLPGPSGP